MGSRRWLVLAVVALAQLMVVLDATIVNIALPAAQTDLGFGDADRQWVVTAYSVAFGCLLLIGGRLSDRFGARAGFIIGLVGFAIASAVGGWAPGFAVLIVARAVQGAFGALLAPAALSLLSLTFRDIKDQGRAFGVYGAVAGGGGAVGLLLGGLLTGYVSWRWCLFVNVVIAAAVVVGAVAALPKGGGRSQQRTDVGGALLVVAGVSAVVLGLGQSESLGWRSPVTLGAVVGGVLLLVLFGVVETGVRDPLLPLAILRSRTRGTSCLVMLLAAAGMFTIYLFLAYYLQRTLHYSPVLSGVAFLPMAICVAVGSTSSGTVLIPRFGLRLTVAAVAAVAAAGFALLTAVGIADRYAGSVLPGLVAAGLGLGVVFGSAMSSAAAGVAPAQSGVASAAVNTTQQVGGSVGIAVLTGLSLSAGRGGGEIAGYHAVFWGAAASLLAAAIVAAVLYSRRVAEVPVRVRPDRRRTPCPSPASSPVPSTASTAKLSACRPRATDTPSNAAFGCPPGTAPSS